MHDVNTPFLQLGRYHLKTPIKYVFLDGFVILFSLFVISFIHNEDGYWNSYWQISILAACLFYTFAALTNLYSSWRSQLFFRESLRLWSSWILTYFFLLGIAFATKTAYHYSRLVFVTWGMVCPVLINGLHIYLASRPSKSLRLDQKKTRAVFVGYNEKFEHIAQSINESAGLNLFVYGYYDTEDKTPQHAAHDHRRHLGNDDDLIEDARSGSFHLVYLNLPLEEQARITRITRELANSTASVYWILPDELSPVHLTPHRHDFGEQHALSLYESPFSGWQENLKRIEDLVLGSLILILIALPMLFIGLLVRLTSKGPIIFKQKRYGESGRSFYMYKFRSMTVTENGDHVPQATANDCRVTFLGKILRKHSLDELPQFFNVIKGEMSIVGPRPHANIHNQYYRSQISGYMMRHKVKPGITGLAQISGFRGITDTPDKMENRVERDLQYIKNWSLWLDIKIILISTLKGFNDPKAF
jgi:putative colanic acid biosysnthesis UDP-glucose lipid carrier transferase